MKDGWRVSDLDVEYQSIKRGNIYISPSAIVDVVHRYPKHYNKVWIVTSSHSRQITVGCLTYAANTAFNNIDTERADKKQQEMCMVAGTISIQKACSGICGHRRQNYLHCLLGLDQRGGRYQIAVLDLDLSIIESANVETMLLLYQYFHLNACESYFSRRCNDITERAESHRLTKVWCFSPMAMLVLTLTYDH
jgi:hypothetical protein